MNEDFIKKLTDRADLCRAMGRGDVPVLLADLDKLLDAQARIAELEAALRGLIETTWFDHAAAGDVLNADAVSKARAALSGDIEIERRSA